jgi:hypothetical protein
VYYPTEADITALQRFCSSDDPTSPEWYKHRAKLIGLKPELLAQIELLTVPDVLALITTLDCGDPSSDKVDGLDSPPQETRDRLALAYAAYEYAVEKGARRKSASAWDWLHEHGCSDYDLPAKPTFMSYIALHKRSVRKQSTGSHNPTSGRIGRSIQRQAER